MGVGAPAALCETPPGGWRLYRGSWNLRWGSSVWSGSCETLHTHVRVLILTTFDHDEYVIEALDVGAAGL